jgi:hypothetical protein
LELGSTFINDHFSYIYSKREDEIVRVHECALLMTLAILRGEDDIFITRWRTLHCYFAAPVEASQLADAEGMRLWDSIDGITDKLEDLVFSLNNFYPVNSWCPEGFPNLNSLRAFATSLEVELDQIPLPIATLERLSLHHSNTCIHFLGFASNAFTSLRLLELEFHYACEIRIDTIRLPALEVLALAGGYELIMGHFDALNLTHLSLLDLRPAEDTPSIFNTITDLLMSLHWECKPAMLRRLISSTPSLRRMHIRRWEPCFQGIAALLEEMNAERGSVIDYTEDPGFPNLISRHHWGRRVSIVDSCIVSRTQ